ncbi:MarR family transcriptional regulator [Streptomyces sp. FXJ1.4098]|uniref:MarR family winged helix-turn-helix transcriptional regulator n=1 Tax=Streptomyces sp. NPDC020845 TaxID=3365096 RepID=UPI002994A9A6|nr:MarR family transcriptional regulator [Streptomyces sp. FXJ1.4098]
MSQRAELLERIIDESRRHYAAWTLFNQTMADRLGLHPTDVQCLSLLDTEPDPLSTGDIARMTGLTPGSATRLVDRLVKAGLVERRADPADRRRALVALVPGAVESLGAAWDEPGEAYRAVLTSFGDEELAVIGEYFRRVAELGQEQVERLSSE